ncbi:MAG: glycosyltransferase [Verrucomicrobia bacterium]|nr:glycosyltransferase [Verrucomicrobiota bacterium]
MTVCLNMIVKNEAAVIARCLKSVAPFINYWVIADTGSTDGTQKIIQDCLKNIPGELHEKPWVDFSHNRNEVLLLSKNKCDYLLFIDADEKLLAPPNYALPPLDCDCYFANTHQENGSTYFRILLAKASLNWQWVGTIHEELHCDQVETKAILQDLVNFSISSDGSRSKDPEKYLKDAALLEKAPPTGRNLLFLALSYEKSEKYELALQNYEKRVAFGGWEEEVFYALYRIASVEALLKKPPSQIIGSYCKAYLYRPSRAEPLYWLGQYAISMQNYLLSYLVSRHALFIPRSTDTVYVEDSVYDYNLLLQYALSARRLGRFHEAAPAFQKVIDNKNLSPAKRAFAREELTKNHLKIKA